MSEFVSNWYYSKKSSNIHKDLGGDGYELFE